MIVVQCHGCFDILHYGHLKHLQAARELGDRLVVTITADQFIRKGVGRPVFTEGQRKEMLQALRCVSEVCVIYEPDAEAAIRMVRPDVYVKGKEYEGRLPEQQLVESLGGRVVFTDTPVYSSTKLVEMI